MMLLGSTCALAGAATPAAARPAPAGVVEPASGDAGSVMASVRPGAATARPDTAVGSAKKLDGADGKPGRPGGEETNPDTPEGARGPSGEAVMVGVTDAGLLGPLTGPDSFNETAARWDVHGTDLGHMFWHRDRLYMVFGDTFGKGGLGGENWRSNALARLAEPDLEPGLLRIDSMITGPGGAARELLPSRKVDGVEKTVIPTNGISTGDRMFLHYMSVRHWGGGSGQWDVGHSGLAYSDDDGETWTVPESAVWPGGSGFEQVAFVRREDRVYSFGIPGGRFGGVRLRWAATDRLLERRSYGYWDGDEWVADAGAAVPVVPSPVGELSVAWNAHYRRWMMMYLNPARRAVVLRTAPKLTGPWGDEQVVVSAERHPGLYAPYIVPLRDIGKEVYFTMSKWGSYNVFLMKMKLERRPRGDAGR